MKKLNRKQVLNVILETLLKEEEEKTKAKAEISKMNLGNDLKELINQFYDNKMLSIADAYIATLEDNLKNKQDKKVEDDAYGNLIKIIKKNPEQKKAIISNYKNLRSKYKPLDNKSKNYLNFAKLVDS